MISNKHGIDATLGVWCVNNTYDFKPTEKQISATTLLKPVKQIVMSRRGAQDDTDLLDLYAARRGSAIHDSIERAWREHYRENLIKLGWPEDKVNRIVINPDEVSGDVIPVYLEKRFSKDVGSWTVSGQADIVLDGQLYDYKTTSVYTYMTDAKAKDYVLQGSIYKYVSDGIITSNTIRINYVFTDWSSSRAKTSANYPATPLLTKEYPLLPEQQIRAWLQNRLNLIEENFDKPFEDIIPCSEEELWIPEPEFKYYSTGNTEGRCQKRFTSEAEAMMHLQMKGKGTVIRVQDPPKRCVYCDLFGSCKQRLQYYPDGKPDKY